MAFLISSAIVFITFFLPVTLVCERVYLTDKIDFFQSSFKRNKIKCLLMSVNCANKPCEYTLGMYARGILRMFLQNPLKKIMTRICLHFISTRFIYFMVLKGYFVLLWTLLLILAALCSMKCIPFVSIDPLMEWCKST